MESQQINVAIQDDLANVRFPKRASGSFAGAEATISEMDEIFERYTELDETTMTSSNINNYSEWSTKCNNLKVVATHGDISLPKR
jgi:hypothetical protein